MSVFQSAFERLELKYVVDEITARAIRDSIAPYCKLDEHCLGLGRGYPITSLYLDTPGLAFHQAKERGDPNRVKLRVRTYSDTSPATLEIKRRRSEIIKKTRCRVDRSVVQDVSYGHARAVIDSDFADDFASIVATAGAEPTLSVRYEREAYESEIDQYARITFDRRIQVCPTLDWNLSPSSYDFCSFDDHWKMMRGNPPIVLEIKCETGSLPWWVTDLIRKHQLVRSSFSKYSIGINLTNQRAGLQATRSRAVNSLGM